TPSTSHQQTPAPPAPRRLNQSIHPALFRWRPGRSSSAPSSPSPSRPAPTPGTTSWAAARTARGGCRPRRSPTRSTTGPGRPASTSATTSVTNHAANPCPSSSRYSPRSICFLNFLLSYD
uniref:Uncharacterized protein n=1 Tax=Aegilops tauschii subsp. strangulata TaxID=200361 RepID=A0A452ZM29_AEGTS